MDSKTLEARQRWTLSQKIDHTLGTIDTFVSRLGGLDKVYCSFSGGKDSTVLLHLCRVLFPDILAVFCNTGNEYPEIIKFVRQTQAAGEQKQPNALKSAILWQIVLPRLRKTASWRSLRFWATHAITKALWCLAT